MKRSIRALVLSAALMCAAGAYAAAISADDLLPPVQAKPAQQEQLLAVKNPEAVQTEKDPVMNVEVTKAETLQDAVNTVVERFFKPDKKSGAEGADYVVRQDGVTFVAVGRAAYDIDGANPTMLRIAHREAYVRAFMNAKAQMAQSVERLTDQSAENFAEWVNRSDTSDSKEVNNSVSHTGESQQGRGRVQDESIKQSVHAVLKGFITYAVYNKREGEVLVALVSTPRSRGEFGRPTPDSVSAATLADGLNAALAEVQSGFVPPVGGRIVVVPGTGETGFVGFGSSVVRYAKNPTDQTDNEIDAQRAAEMRAASALVGIIIGDDTDMKRHLDQNTLRSLENYEKYAKGDASVGGTDAEVAAVEESRRRVLSTISKGSQSNAITSLRSGILPPGVKRYTWVDDDGYFAYGMAVYIPTLSDMVTNAAQRMKDAKLLQDHYPQPERKPAARSGQTSEGPQTGGAYTPSAKDYKNEQRPGPSGVVNQNL